MAAEGWYRDPYAVHTDRWFSNGHPTNLVRDDGVECQDDPPPGPVPGPLVEIPEGSASGSDLKRADGLEAVDQSFTSRQGVLAYDPWIW